MSPCLDRIRLANLILILLFPFFPSQANAQLQVQDIASIFQSANQYYAQSNYPQAIEQYEKILKSAMVSDVVLYNLGNAYFKNNQLGKAILCYEKAQRLAPRDREIGENLNFARARIADKVERPPENSFLSQLRRVTNWLSLDAETALAVALFFAANASFSIFWLDVFPAGSRWALYAFVVLLVLVLVLGASNLVRIYWQETLHEGVVLVEKTDVLSGPAADSPTLFSIHEGLKVRIENVLPEWTQISLENGWNGWIRKDTLGEI